MKYFITLLVLFFYNTAIAKNNDDGGKKKRRQRTGRPSKDVFKNWKPKMLASFLNAPQVELLIDDKKMII